MIKKEPKVLVALSTRDSIPQCDTVTVGEWKQIHPASHSLNGWITFLTICQSVRRLG